MRLVCTSDTHNNYPLLPEGDILVHCGDLTYRGTMHQMMASMRWLGEQKHGVKLVAPGNHDFAMENLPASFWWDEYKVMVLRDCGYTSIMGYQFYGSPWTPIFQRWAFMKSEEELARVFQGIPKKLDVLITHGPPFGILDQNYQGTHCGSRALLEAVERTKPRFHLFGHIHESYGRIKVGETEFINCAYVGVEMGSGAAKPPNPPVVIDL